MRGYFGLGAEKISKAHNLGAIWRTGHAFGSSFLFTIDSPLEGRDINQTDTSSSFKSVPMFEYDSWDDFKLPKGCMLVGVELTDDAVELPEFSHPRCAAYIFGPELGSLSPEVQAKCDHIVKIPTKFCINVSVAAAMICYDRVLQHGDHALKPIMPGGPQENVAKRKDKR